MVVTAIHVSLPAPALRIRQVGGAYIRHVIGDLRHGAGVPHLVADVVRAARMFSNPGAAVSSPPHSLRLYGDFLERLLRAPRCRFLSLRGLECGRRHPDAVNVVLRHDLDAGNALVAERFCAVEQAVGLCSSVHVLVDGRLYDAKPLSTLARALHAAGFDVGLHTQAWIEPSYRAALWSDIGRFEALFGFSPRTLSLHGAWPRTAADLERRRDMVRVMPDLLEGSQIGGHTPRFDRGSEGLDQGGRPQPIKDSFFQLSDRCYLGGAALVLTHDNHWLPDVDASLR